MADKGSRDCIVPNPDQRRLPPTTGSMKTHTGHGHSSSGHGDGSMPSRGRHNSAADRHHHRHHHHRRHHHHHHDFSPGITTPTPVQQSSEGEDDSSWCGGVAGSTPNKKRGQTEVEVIRDWFVNIFMPLEKTADLEVIDFKFEQLNHLRSGNNSRLVGNCSSSSSTSRPLIKGSSRQQNGLDEDDILSDSSGDPAAFTPPFTVLKKADVELKVGGKAKTISVVIKVLPTDDVERHTCRRKFADLLKFSKEVQVYCQALRCMVSYDEKRYASACVEPPVPKCYLGQLDAQNDVLVLENLGQSGYRKFNGGPGGRHLADVDHCRVVLRRLAHFHAFSTVIQRDADEALLDLFPFAVDASVFRDAFQARVAVVRAELVKYLVCNKGMVTEDASDVAGEKVERHLQDLFWRLVELRAQPHNMRMCVLAHGALDLRNIVFLYDETSGRPVSAKFLDFSTLTVSSPVIDISYFLHSSVLPEVASHHHANLLTVYHRAHLEAIKSFGMHGFEMELEDLLTEYHAKQDYGAMMACLLKPALYVLQCLETKGANTKNGASASNGEKKASLLNGDNGSSVVVDIHDDIRLEHESSLKIDKNLVPVDLRLHGYLSSLAKACPCPCAVGSRELTIAELSADSLEDLHLVAKQQSEDHRLKAFDCNGGTKSTLKKLFLGFINNNNNSSSNKDTAEDNSNSSSKNKQKDSSAAAESARKV